MSAHGFTRRRWRLLLDCVLITLALLSAAVHFLPVAAKPDPRQSAGMAAVTAPADPGDLDGVVSSSTASETPLDNELLAAMIAAENATLTGANYFLDLPLARR
jgi:hypothetical protein